MHADRVGLEAPRRPPEHEGGPEVAGEGDLTPERRYPERPHASPLSQVQHVPVVATLPSDDERGLEPRRAIPALKRIT
jgi:hypothetical protein